jgi:hypothetical protein
MQGNNRDAKHIMSRRMLQYPHNTIAKKARTAGVLHVCNQSLAALQEVGRLINLDELRVMKMIK